MSAIRTDAAKGLPARRELYVAVLLTLAAITWFVANAQGPRGPQVLGRVPGILALAVTAVSLRRVAVAPGLHPGARRFWNRIARVAGLCALGATVRAYNLLGGSWNQPELSTVPGVIYLVAMLSAVWALLRIPVGQRTATDRIRLSLDVATVVLGASLFAWYLVFAPMLAGGQLLGVVWAPLAIAAVCLAGLSAVIKVALAGTGPVDSVALRLFGAGLLVGGISAGFGSVALPPSHLLRGNLLGPVISCLVILAGERQLRAARQAPQPARRQRRPYSLLPYAAVAATDVLLVLATVGPGDNRRPVVVAGAITITALVVVRQLAAFVDNARLVDQLREREDQLRHQASHDALTQLANRALFGERVSAAVEARPGAVLAVLLVDLDDFKTVNDTLGHGVGDLLLTKVAQRIQRCVRPEDTVARLGGDEFAVLLARAGPAEVDVLAESILASLTRPLLVDGCQLLVQASIGVAIARPGDDAEALLRHADIAMYASKERGKGRSVRYAPGMAAQILEHAQTGAQLRQALNEGELHLVYQPIVRFADRRIVGVETLVRWHHPVRGLVRPNAFIPAAERTGLIVPLGRWALHEACRQKATWNTDHGAVAPATIGVNVAGRQLQEPGFADEVADALYGAGLLPRDLVLEVTESAVLTGGHVLQTLKALHELGVSLALDDFGTGQSSLGLVRTCPVHILKLDKSFVDRITDGGQHTAVATAVIHMAHALGLTAVAEGIETEEQVDRLVELGYCQGQGFHLARPLLPEQLTELLNPAQHMGERDGATALLALHQPARGDAVATTGRAAEPVRHPR